MRHRLASCALALLCASVAHAQTHLRSARLPALGPAGKGEARGLSRPQVPPPRRRRGDPEGLRDARRRHRRGRRDARDPRVLRHPVPARRRRRQRRVGLPAPAQVRATRTRCSTRRSSTPALNWQIYNGPGFTGAVDIPKDAWFHLRLEVTGAQAKLYVKDMEKPALVMDDLKSGVQKGQVALYVLIGRDVLLELRDPDDARRALGAAPAADAAGHADEVEHLARPTTRSRATLERPLTAAESAAIQWQDVEAEPPGFVVLYRYREAPHRGSRSRPTSRSAWSRSRG